LFEDTSSKPIYIISHSSSNDPSPGRQENPAASKTTEDFNIEAAEQHH
jgi:hypothetical protein